MRSPVYRGRLGSSLPSSTANLIFSRSSGCSTRVDTTPPLTPATRCSYLTVLAVEARSFRNLAPIEEVAGLGGAPLPPEDEEDEGAILSGMEEEEDGGGGGGGGSGEPSLFSSHSFPLGTFAVREAVYYLISHKREERGGGGRTGE